MKKTLFEYLLVILLLSPLLFINIRDSHDWGDDFAGYLRQAKNIAEGKPFYQSKFEFHDYNTRYSPPYYSYGFPLLLAPVVKAYGLDFKALDQYMSLWVMAWALLVFAYLRRYFSFFTSVCFVLLFFLNPFFFEFKTFVLSDVPFSFFFLLTLMLYLRRSGKPLYYQVLTGLAFAFAIGIRSIALLMLPLMLAEAMIGTIRYLRNKTPRVWFRKETISTVIIILSAFAFFLIFSQFFFKAPADLTSHFIGLFRYDGYEDVVLKNLDVYTTDFTNLFRHDVDRYTFVLQYSSAFMLVLLVIGFFNSIFSRHSFEIAVATIFSSVVVLFPYSNQGFRYLLPVLPVFMLCIITGAKSIQLSTVYNRRLIALLFAVFMLLQYKKELREMHRHQAETVWPGPFINDDRQAFDHVKTVVPEGQVIACLKPRALELFTGRSSCVLPPDTNMQDAVRKLETAKPKYLLSIKELGNRVDDIASLRKDSLIWENNACRLYICKDQNH